MRRYERRRNRGLMVPTMFLTMEMVASAEIIAIMASIFGIQSIITIFVLISSGFFIVLSSVKRYFYVLERQKRYARSR